MLDLQLNNCNYLIVVTLNTSLVMKSFLDPVNFTFQSDRGWFKNKVTHFIDHR